MTVHEQYVGVSGQPWISGPASGDDAPFINHASAKLDCKLMSKGLLALQRLHVAVGLTIAMTS